MLLKTDIDTLKTIKYSLRALLPDEPSTALTEALARGLGWSTQAAALADLKTGTAIRCIDDDAFRARLTGLAGGRAALKEPVLKEPVLQAAVVAAADRLVGQSHQEGVLAGLAVEATRLRDESAAEAVEGLSLNIRHDGDNAFDIDASLDADDRMTIWGDADEGRCFLAGDVATLRGIAQGFDRDWIDDYVPEGVDLSRVPLARSGCGYNGRFVIVWDDAVLVQTVDGNGDISVDVTEIDAATSRALVSAMRQYDLYDAQRVVAAMDILENGIERAPAPVPTIGRDR